MTPGDRTTDAPARRPRRRRPAPSPDVPLGVLDEYERDRDGRLHPVSTVFLAGAECPFSCVFCDLWQHALPGPTPAGAIPRQLDVALARIDHRARIKLYNGSNFFDDRAVPPVDEPRLLAQLAGFDRVIVECHPRFIDTRCFAFATRLPGRLEVAIGLETVHPDALPRLGKQMTLADFDAAAAALRARGIALRVFVLLGAPYVPADAQVEWTLRSVEHAAARGAETVSIIPVRGAPGPLATLAARNHWRPVTLDVVETALDRAVRADGPVVQVDLWDLDRVSTCDACLPARRARLAAINQTGRPRPPIDRRCCGPGAAA